MTQTAQIILRRYTKPRYRKGLADDTNAHPRTGKTARQFRNGKHAKHLRNQALRREWNIEYMRNAKTGGLRVIPYPIIS